MFRMKFGRLLFIFGTLFVFGVIYQHNLIIKLNYTKQRLALKKTKLIKEQNELMKELYQLRDPSTTRVWAVENQGMKDLVMSHVVTLTVQAQGDFFVTSTTNQV